MSSTSNRAHPAYPTLDLKVLRTLQDFDPLSRVRANDFSQDTVKQLMESSKTEIKHYDTEISKLRSSIIAVENRKKETELHVKRLHMLIIPIRKLAQEILQ